MYLYSYNPDTNQLKESFQVISIELTQDIFKFGLAKVKVAPQVELNSADDYILMSDDSQKIFCGKIYRSENNLYYLEAKPVDYIDQTNAINEEYGQNSAVFKLFQSKVDYILWDSVTGIGKHFLDRDLSNPIKIDSNKAYKQNLSIQDPVSSFKIKLNIYWEEYRPVILPIGNKLFKQRDLFTLTPNSLFNAWPYPMQTYKNSMVVASEIEEESVSWALKDGKYLKKYKLNGLLNIQREYVLKYHEMWNLSINMFGAESKTKEIELFLDLGDCFALYPEWNKDTFYHKFDRIVTHVDGLTFVKECIADHRADEIDLSKWKDTKIVSALNIDTLYSSVFGQDLLKTILKYLSIDCLVHYPSLSFDLILPWKEFVGLQLDSVLEIECLSKTYQCQVIYYKKLYKAGESFVQVRCNPIPRSEIFGPKHEFNFQDWFEEDIKLNQKNAEEISLNLENYTCTVLNDFEEQIVAENLKPTKILLRFPSAKMQVINNVESIIRGKL